MAAKEFTITDFLPNNNNDSDSWKGYATGAEVDFFGDGPGESFLSEPGKIAPLPRLLLESEGAVSAGNEVSALVEWIRPFNGSTFGVTNNGNMVVSESAPSAVSGQTWYRVSTISATTGGGGLAPFGSNLYYGQDAVLGKTDGTATNNNFLTFSDSTANPRPMQIFGGKLHVGNGRYVATVDSDETTTKADALTLPAGYQIKSMEIWQDRLAISADFTPSGSTNSTSSKLFLWDGTSPSHEEPVVLPFKKAPLLGAKDGLLWLFGIKDSVSGSVWFFDGSLVQELVSYPLLEWHGIGSLAHLGSNLAVGANGIEGSGSGGVWVLGKTAAGHYGVMRSYVRSGGLGTVSDTSQNFGGLYGEGVALIGAWQISGSGNGAFGLDRLDTNSSTSPSYHGTAQITTGFITPPEARGKDMTFLGIKPHLNATFATLGASSTIKVAGRVNDGGGNVSSGRTLTASDTDLRPYVPLRGLRGDSLQVVMSFTTSASEVPWAVDGFTFYYNIHGQHK